MVEVTDDEFQEIINTALGELPNQHVKNIKNVAILYESQPTPGQRQELELHKDQTLLGLYQGVPLSQRQGLATTLPDKITLFKDPLCWKADTMEELKEEIKHTLWHEIAHYYGLNHDQIHNLE